MKLYYHPISTYSQKVLIALYEKGIDFDAEIVQLMDAEGRAAYREVYPMGKIPCLFTDDGHMVPESSIIIEYLDTIAEPTLVKGDNDGMRRIRLKDRMFDLYLNENVATLLFQSIKPEAERDSERIEKAKFQIETLYGFMQHEFGQQEYANGNEFLMGDCSAAPALFYAQRVIPFDQHDNICAYWDRLCSRQSIQKTQEDALPALEAFLSQNAT